MASEPPMRIYTSTLHEATAQQGLLAEKSQEIQRAQREGFAEIRWDDAEVRGRYLALSDGSLWRRERGIPREGRKPRDWRYVITHPPEGVAVGIAWYRRSLAPEPETVAELDERERRRDEAAERQRRELEKRWRALRKDPPKRVLTIGDESPMWSGATLRVLAQRLQAAGGVLVVEPDGGLTVRAEVVSDQVIRLGGLLSRAAPTIVALARRKPGAIDPDTLPDAQITIGGDLLPAGLVGREV
jgi:hypothetical protein